ncbi:MAG: tetratricopeptide (TPR) repeat protein [Flavobacteriales bacterium]|jgi:tetratricopeptide (TPR) repeat protein|tara:strand:+ start:670 stop:1266 length:597 start_codon:yes stop_codon:yes gene_type:complete
MILKQILLKHVEFTLNKTLLILLLSVFGLGATAQKVFIPKLNSYEEKEGGVDIDTSTTVSDQKIKTSVDYDVSDLFSLDLTEAERAQAKAIIEIFSQQIQEDTSNISAYINRGSYWATLGLHVQAIKDYDRALLISDDQPIIYYNRALSKARFFYTYDACLDLKKSRDLGLMQANTLMMQQCGRHMAKLNSDTLTVPK